MTETGFQKLKQNKVKSFEDLKDEVINNNKCCACGACIAYCESQNFNVIEMNRYTPEFKSEKSVDNCTKCGVCYYICPQTDILIKELNDTYCIEDKIGRITKILAAKTTNNILEKIGQDGGVVSAILAHLFEKHKIDAAIVSEFSDNFKPVPKIIFDKEDLFKSAGTRYSISPQIFPLKNLYNIPQNILNKNEIFDIDQLRIAFIGTPCQCRAVRKMKFLLVKPAHVIKYIIGLFCFENFTYTELYDILKIETNVEPTNIKKTWIKKNFFIQTKDNKKFEINIKTLNPAVRSNCHECDEFTGRFTDISVGASGAPEGYSMLLIRTEKGEKVVNNMLSKGIIEQLIVPSNRTIEWKNKKLEWYNKLISLKIENQINSN
ncbi:MAG: Coenzyme F420 hydrogenase/dehydrogenase, beta subunit C-terminal domain [Promethearchaeota archaeon]|nr:MAG: Coenzyme F420 hydrogenase/dehydrogenase, beta subunit C-terminal domain [Candidatus Lokiarchaeota archaeon]